MVEGVKIFGTKDRDQCHKELERLLIQYPKAECREYINDENEPYQIFDGPVEVRIIEAGTISNEPTYIVKLEDKLKEAVDRIKILKAEGILNDEEFEKARTELIKEYTATLVKNVR